jgi:outer membrane immunogenic protein
MKSFRPYLIATTSYAALIGSAAAADMAIPTKAPPPVATPISNWTGPYVGVGAGAALDHSSYTDVDYFFFLLPTGPNNNFWTPTPIDFTASGLAGYNYQFSKFVLGIEGDLNWIGGKHTAGIGSFATGGVTASTNMDWLSTVRARAGVLLSDATLLYATGGAAFTRFSDSWGSPITPSFRVIDSYSRTGSVLGGGIEYMFAPHWTGRVEALYADFGSHITTTFGSGQTYRTKFEHDTTLVRAALTFKW